MRRKSGPKSLHISRVHEPPEREPSFAGRFSARDSSRPRSRALRLRRLARNSAASRRARSAAFLDLPSLSSGMRHLITRVAADPASARFSEDPTAFFSGVDVPEPLHALFVFRAARHEVIGASAGNGIPVRFGVPWLRAPSRHQAQKTKRKPEFHGRKDVPLDLPSHLPLAMPLSNGRHRFDPPSPRAPVGRRAHAMLSAKFGPPWRGKSTAAIN